VDDESRRAYFRDKQREYRSKLSKGVKDNSIRPTSSKEITQAEAEAKADTKAEAETTNIDGSQEFEFSCSLYPKPERSNATQVAYFEAIGWIRKRKNVSDRTAIDYLNNRIGLYRNTGYPCGFRKFLNERIFEQDESQWKEKGNGKPKGALGVLEQLEADARQLDGK